MKEMLRLLFTLICTVLLVVIMSGLAYALKQTTPDFTLGFGIGAFAATFIIWICHKLGAQIF